MAKGSTNGMGRRGLGRKQDQEVDSGQRPTMGTSVYSMRPDAPSGTEFRNGMLEAKPGIGKSDAPVGRKSNRKQVMAQTTLGARYHITPSIKQSDPGPDPRVQSSSKIVPPAMGTGRNFWGQERSYGAY